MPKFKVTVLEHRNFTMRVEAATAEDAMEAAQAEIDSTVARGFEPGKLYPSEITLVEAVDAEPAGGM